MIEASARKSRPQGEMQVFSLDPEYFVRWRSSFGISVLPAERIEPSGEVWRQLKLPSGSLGERKGSGKSVLTSNPPRRPFRCKGFSARIAPESKQPPRREQPTFGSVASSKAVGAYPPSSQEFSDSRGVRSVPPGHVATVERPRS